MTIVDSRISFYSELLISILKYFIYHTEFIIVHPKEGKSAHISQTKKYHKYARLIKEFVGQLIYRLNQTILILHC